MTLWLTGSFRVVREADGAELVIGSPKERRLLALLAVHHDRTVSTDQIVDVLWDSGPPRRPAENVATLVSRLRALVGSEVILGDRGVYRLGSAPAVRVDADEAAQLLANALQRMGDDLPALAGTAAGRALELLGDGSALIGEPDADWVDAARTRCQQLVRSARHCAAAAALRTGEFEHARTIAGAAVDLDQFDEIAYRLLMSAHQAAGEPAKARRCFRR